MTTTLQTRTATFTTTPTARATVLIDLGNGDVKAMSQLPGSDKWEKCKFPSHVAESPGANSDCLRLVTSDGDKDYLVGEFAADIVCSQTGRTAVGKIENARPLLLYAIHKLIGFSKMPLHVDVIFTSPSVKSYGPQIVQQLQKSHWVRTPADAEVIGSTESETVINVHLAIPQLEGYQAFSYVQSKVKDHAYIMDIGSRTVLLTKVSETGRILARTPFDSCGVQAIAQRIRDGEALAQYMHTPSIQTIIDFLLDRNHDDIVKDEIAPHILACMGEILETAGDSPKFIIGGGAKLPGIQKLIGGKTIKSPQWANLTALSVVADELIRRAV